jgi:PAS domain S-box-containing protein
MGPNPGEGVQGSAGSGGWLGKLSIRGRLLLLAAAMLAPYVMFAAYSAYDGQRGAVLHALDECELEAKRIARLLESHVERVDALLAAAEVALAAAGARDPGQVAAMLRQLLAAAPPAVVGMGVFSPEGRILASTLEPERQGGPVNVSDRDYFRAALRTRAVAIGAPIRPRIGGGWIVSMARPVVGSDGEVKAVVGAATGLQAMHELLAARVRQPADLVSVATDKGITIARIPGGEPSWGSDASETSYFRVARAGDMFKGEVTTPDGVRRFGASVPVANAPWQVFVGTPVEAALAPAWARLREHLAIAALMLLVAALAAAFIGRGLALPIRRLQRSVTALARNGVAHRVPVSAGGEIGELARDINAMVEQLERSQRELQESEARFRSLAGLSSDWYWETDFENRVAKIEGDIEGALGPEATVRGRSLRELGIRVSGDRAAQVATLARREPFRDVEFVRVDAAGEIVQVFLISGEPRFGPDGEYLGYRGVARDVTERNRLEAKVRRARERLRLVVDAVPAMLAYVESDEERFVFVNNAYERLTGRTPKDTVGHTVREVVGEAVYAEIRPYMQRALGGETVEFARQRVMPDGSVVDLRIQYVPDRAPSGRVRAIVGLVSDVSELKRVQRSLAENEARYRELTELSTDWYWETDAEHRFSYVSPGVERNLDLGILRLLGKAPWEIDYLNMSAADWMAHRAVLGARQPFRDLRLARRSRAGQVTYQSITGRPMFDPDGRFLGYRGVGHDITATVEAEVALRAERDRLTRIIETMAEGLAILDAQGRYVLVNAAAERILGARREALVGRHFLDVPWSRLPLGGGEPGTPPEVFERLRGGEERVLGPAVYVLQRTDGLQRVLSHHAARIEDGKGGFAGVVATFEDITERMHAERRLQLYFASALEGYLMADLDGHILEVNRAMCEILGYSEEELLRMSVTDTLVDETREQFLERSRTLREAGHSQIKARRRRKDGSVVVLEGASTYLPIEGGRVFAFYRDVTERVEAERKLAEHEREIMQLNAELERRVEERTAELTAAYREMESFSYSVSHDLRAPLRAISGFSHILMEDFRGDVPPEANRLLARVAQNAERMGALIDGLLELGKLSRQPLRKERIEPADLVREVLEELQPLRQGREIDVRVGTLPACHADRVLLKQVFANLLGNAIKYTARRSHARIEVGSIVMGLGPVYYVRDNGAGFDMAYAGKLFGMFQRLHSPSEFEGNGVGLALVRRIVERHDGKVWADSAPEKGATFFFRIGNGEPLAGRVGAAQAA